MPMASETVVCFALGRLHELLIQEEEFLYKLGSQVHELRQDLTQAQCFIDDLDSGKFETQMDLGRLSEIRDLSFHLENVIEKYVFHVASWKEQDSKNILQRSSFILNEHKQRSKVAKNMSLFRDKIRDIVRGSEGQNREINRSREPVIRRPNMSDFVNEDFVGREKDITKLVEMILEDNQSGIVSICGMGGLGKTTIAKKVYKHEDVRRFFKGFALVHISQNFDVTLVLKHILKELAPGTREQEIEAMSDSALICQQIHKLLKEKKFLVVLDDIWTMEAWNALTPAFPVFEMQSKILITTRIRIVAQLGRCHDLGCLSKEESWELFRNKALPEMEITGSTQYREMEKLGREMVRRCMGLPLAVLVLRGFMVTKHSLTEWERAYKRLNLYHGGKELAQVHKEISRVLSLSYSELPYKLKPCFLYLAIFRGSRLYTSEVYKMWIAEGIIQPEDQSEEETMMDVAKRYMSELAQRSMIEVKSQVNLQTSEYVHLHDVMHELCLSRADEENFIKIADSFSSNAANGHRIYFLLDENSATKIVTPKKETTQRVLSIQHHIRFSSSQRLRWPKEAFHLTAFKFLRALSIEGYNFGNGKILEEIGLLIHLRYLCFWRCVSAEAPSSIGNLVYLHTVILDLGYEDVMMPNIIWKTKRLSNLFLPFKIKGKDKVRLNHLVNLEELGNFDPNVCEVKDLFSLTRLRKMEANIRENHVDLGVMIDYLESPSSKYLHYSRLNVVSNLNVDYLVRRLFECNRVHVLRIQGSMTKFPRKNINISQSLVTLNLIRSGLEEDPLPILEKLPNLERLTIFVGGFVGKQMTCSKIGFAKLKFLQLVSLPNLENLIIHGGGMSNLHDLYIKGCKKLKMLPEGLRFITSLKQLKFDDMPQVFVKRVQVIDNKEGQDFYKVRHVPCILIQ